MPIGDAELPTGWKEKPYVEKVSLAENASFQEEFKLTC